MQGTLAVISLLFASAAFAGHSKSPPRGWNSYDSYNWVITEAEFLQNAKWQADNLLPYGYDTAVVDYLWFMPLNGSTTVNDKYGRPQPDPARWPSSANGAGFGPVARQVHQMGLKFGIHVMRGITSQARDANTPVLNGGGATTKSIVQTDGSAACPWYQFSIAINATAPGAQAYFDSMVEQWAGWGVDFIKNDCVFAGNYEKGDILAMAQAFSKHKPDMVYSLSPGGNTATPAMARDVAEHVDMYRICGDDWDKQSDLLSHFAPAAQFAAAGLTGYQGSFPDLDMLPLGYIAQPCGNNEDKPSCRPNHQSALTHGQQRMQMTLWQLSRSPLFFGGVMNDSAVDPFTWSMLTNRELLDLNADEGANGTCVLNCEGYPSGIVAWRARATTGHFSGVQYAAVLNAGASPATATLQLSQFGIQAPPAGCSTREVWSGSALAPAVGSSFQVEVPAQDAVVVAFAC